MPSNESRVFSTTKPWTAVGASCLFIVGLSTSGQAGTLGWTLPIGQTQLLSDGITPIPAGTVFQLGVFAGSFVPDADNQAEWAENWRAADFANYLTEFSTVDGYYNVEENIPPFVAGKQMYVWGVFLKANDSSEQWLGTASTWELPSDNPLDFPVQIEINDATTLLLGEANSTAGTIQMAAAAAGEALPLLYGDPWRGHYFTMAEMADPAIGAWEADPDRDGLSNSLEFTMGSNPLDPRSFGSMTIQAQPGSFLLSCPGWASAAVTVGMEESGTLQAPWTALSSAPDFDAGLSRWELEVSSESLRHFFRTTVAIPDLP